MAGVCTAMAVELRAGRRPEEALAAAVQWAPGTLPEPLPSAARAAEVGGDVVAVLRGAPGGRPEVDAAPAALAACWEATRSTGAGLATALERLAESLRAEDEHRLEVAAQLAAPRATARLLAVLPAVGLLLGAGLGADPVGFLLGSPVGLACLLAGLILDLAGLAWTHRIVRVAESR